MNPTVLVPKTSARIYYYLAFWTAVAQGITIAVLWRQLPKVVPLFFTQPWGEARLAPKIFLLILPLLAIASITTNLILGKWAKEESELLPYTLAVASLLIVIMLTIALAGILQSIL